jgi:hypothetical protein
LLIRRIEPVAAHATLPPLRCAAIGRKDAWIAPFYPPR